MKEILIPDEYVPNYRLPKEEEKKRHEEHIKKSNKAFEKLDKVIKEGT